MSLRQCVDCSQLRGPESLINYLLLIGKHDIRFQVYEVINVDQTKMKEKDHTPENKFKYLGLDKHYDFL